MSRLTLEEVQLNNSIRPEFKHFTDFIDQEQKELIEYKVIERDLGIDLITLFKAVKQGYVYRKIYVREEDVGTNNFEIVKTDFDLFIFEESRKSNNVLECACLGKIEEVGNYKQCYQYLNYISSYGKTWALTKEELRT